VFRPAGLATSGRLETNKGQKGSGKEKRENRTPVVDRGGRIGSHYVSQRSAYIENRK
jgi:hypothetical protein